jgi:hypothetical protein
MKLKERVGMNQDGKEKRKKWEAERNEERRKGK